jgi:hypothetical protein
MKIIVSKIRHFIMIVLIGAQSALTLGASVLHMPQQQFDAFYKDAYTHVLPHLSPKAVTLLNITDSFKKLHVIADLISQNKPLAEHVKAMHIEVAAECAYKLLETYSASLLTIVDALEKAVVYWQWCADHPLKYAISKSPIKWFTGSAQPQEVFEKQALIRNWLQLFITQYGSVMKHEALLESCKTAQERFVWTQEAVAVFDACDIAVVHHKPLTIEALSEDIIALQEAVKLHGAITKNEIQSVVMPSHWERHWLPYTVTVVGLVATAVLATKYKTNILEGAEWMRAGAGNGFKEYVTDPLNDLLKEVTKVLWPNTLDKEEMANQFAMIDEKLKLAQDAIAPDPIPTNWIPGSTGATMDHANKAIEDFKKAGVHGLDACKDGLALIEQSAERVAQSLEETGLNRRLIALIPATLGVYGIYKGFSRIKNWFTKHDYRMLCTRLFQANEILIRAGDTLSDKEYGRLVYILVKESEQVHKHIDASERAEFMQDLHYLALPQSTIEQKKETIAQMWQKYQALKNG